jgi:pimeloyl-ACP methyl ester carboxylesterase
VLGPATVTTPEPDRLFHTELGDHGPRVAFLHGLFGQGKNWTSVAKALSPDARVTLFDLPNHGRSPWTDRFSYPDMATQVAEELRRIGSDEPYALVGHSMGGKVAMVIALHHSELVERLCVVDVSPVSTAEISSFEGYVDAMRSIDLTRLSDRASAEAQLAAHIPEAQIRSFLLQNLRREQPPASGWRWQMNLELMGDELREMGSWPALDAAPYPGPVLWLAGSESSYIQPAFAPAMRALFPRVQLVTVKGAGHWLHSDQPAVFLATMRRFLHL